MKSLKLNWFLTSFFLQAARLLLVELLLCTLHQRYDVTHAEDTVGHTFGMKHLQGVHLLAARNEFQRFADHRADRDRGTAAGVAVELRQDHAGDIRRLIELLCLHKGVLSCRSVQHHQSFPECLRILPVNDTVDLL